MSVIDRLDTLSAWEELESSPDALDKFRLRAALAFENELKAAGIEHHSVNDKELAVGANGFNCAIGLDMWESDGRLCFASREGLAGFQNTCPETPPITSLSDSELRRAFREVVKLIKAKNIVFGMLYTPRAVAQAWQCNNLRVSFRFVKAWDVLRSLEIMRFDFLYKDLTA